jgi:hypothetical protein
MSASTQESGTATALQTTKTRAWGMFLAVLTTSDGRTIEGSGWSEQVAEYRARRRAEETR